jgi:hypothetical protein
MRDKITQARQDTVETLNASFEEKVGEALSLIRAGQGDDPRVAQLVQETQGHYDAAKAEGLVSEADVTAALEGFKDARTHEAALTEINAAVEAGDFDGARAMIDDVRDNAAELDLNPDQARRLEAAGRAVVSRGEQARRRQQIENDRARAKVQGTTYMQLQRRMAGGESITLDEVDKLRAEGKLSDGQAGSLYGTIGSRVASEKARSFKENSAKLVTDFNTRKASFPELMARKDELTTSDWLQIREANHRQWSKRADLKAKAGVERLTSRWSGAVDRGEPLGDPETYARLMWQAADNAAITPNTARSRIDSYRNAYGGLVEDQRVTRSMMTQLQDGAVTGKDERNRFEEVFATELNPLEAGADVTATAVSRAGYIPAGLQRRFETIEQVDRESAQTLLDAFQGIRAAKLNGSSEAMLQQELGAETFRKLDTLARLAPQTEDWNQALKLANDAAKPDGSYRRKIAEVMRAEDADDARTALHRTARSHIHDELHTGPGFFLSLMERVFDPRDPRLQAFMDEADAYGLDLGGQTLPGHVLDDVAMNAETLIGTGLATTPQAAVRRGLAMSLQTYGPERVGNQVRWTRNPISWHANRTNRMVPGFQVSTTELQQDFRFQMRAAGKLPPGKPNSAEGPSWDDIELRFDPVPGADDEWQVLYEDPDYAGEWHPLIYQDADGEEVAVTYSYEWADPDGQPVSLHAELYQAALEGKEGGRLAATIKDLGVKFLTRWAAGIDVDLAITARRSRREWTRFWEGDVGQAITGTPWTLGQWQERQRKSADALIDALVSAESRDQKLGSTPATGAGTE